MLKNLIRLQHVVGDNVYQLICDPTSPISEIRVALQKFSEYVDQVERNAKAPLPIAPTPPEQQPISEEKPDEESPTS